MSAETVLMAQTPASGSHAYTGNASPSLLLRKNVVNDYSGSLGNEFLDLSRLEALEDKRFKNGVFIGTIDALRIISIPGFEFERVVVVDINEKNLQSFRSLLEIMTEEDAEKRRRAFLEFAKYAPDERRNFYAEHLPYIPARKAAMIETKRCSIVELPSMPLEEGRDLFYLSNVVGSAWLSDTEVLRLMRGILNAPDISDDSILVMVPQSSNDPFVFRKAPGLRK